MSIFSNKASKEKQKEFFSRISSLTFSVPPISTKSSNITGELIEELNSFRAACDLASQNSTEKSKSKPYFNIIKIPLDKLLKQLNKFQKTISEENNPDLNSLISTYEQDYQSLHKVISELSDILKETSKVKFMTLHASRLNYKPTKKKLLELSKQLLHVSKEYQIFTFNISVKKITNEFGSILKNVSKRRPTNESYKVQIPNNKSIGEYKGKSTLELVVPHRLLDELVYTQMLRTAFIKWSSSLPKKDLYITTLSQLNLTAKQLDSSLKQKTHSPHK